jgi:release factor glutamine methyltransferase
VIYLKAPVYSPAEDSFLLEGIILINKKLIKGKKCLDLGCGSGIISSAFLDCGAEKVMALDINKNALDFAKKSILKKYAPELKIENKINFVESDLFSNVHESFDVIAFNPPYVPSEEIKWVDLDGGKDGREIIDQFLETFPDFLSENGIVFLLCSSLNKSAEIKKKLAKKGFTVKKCKSVDLDSEELFVFLIKKK